MQNLHRFSLYRNPADALKEHVTNAIDEPLNAKLDGTVHEGRADEASVENAPARLHATTEVQISAV